MMIAGINPTSESLEIEFKYYIDISNNSLPAQLADEQNSISMITYLFDLKNTSQILKEFGESIGIADLANQNLSQFKGRLRSSTRDGKTTYNFDLKGPKNLDYQKLGLVAKLEISIAISKNLFDQIATKFPTGYFQKKRIICDLALDSNPDIPLKAEFDLYQSVNGFEVSPKFLVMEIEIPETTTWSPQEIIVDIRKNNATLCVSDAKISLADLNAEELVAESTSELSDIISGRRLVKLVKTNIPASHKKYFN